MFHRIIFLLLIVSSLSCKFNRCADCFQSFSKQRFSEYSKCRALKGFKIKNKHNNFFILLEHNSVNVHSNTRHCQHCKSQNRLAVQMILKRFTAKAHACFNRPEQQFVSQHCEILHSVVRGLYDKNSASQYCFSSDVMYK